MKIRFQRKVHWQRTGAPKERFASADRAINQALSWREIERHLEGIQTILDAGAGRGEFSIPLAQRGFQVTHAESSPLLLELARQSAGDLPNMRFVEAGPSDLSTFDARAFDLVLSMNGAISLCGCDAENAIHEHCRVARKKLIITLYNRAAMVPVAVSSSLRTRGELPPSVYVVFDQGEWYPEERWSNERDQQPRGIAGPGPIKAFLAAELLAILEDAGMKAIRVGGIGSLANLCGPEVIQKVMAKQATFEEFVALAERFDLTMLPDGPGSREHAGLIAVAAKPD